MLEQIGRSVAGFGTTIVELIDMFGAVLAASGTGDASIPPPSA